MNRVRPARGQDEAFGLADAVRRILHRHDNLDLRTEDVQTDVVRLLVAPPGDGTCAANVDAVRGAPFGVDDNIRDALGQRGPRGRLGIS